MVVGIVFSSAGLSFLPVVEILIGSFDGWLAANSSSSVKNWFRNANRKRSDVTVEVTPRVSLGRGHFDVKFTTHSVDLDFNLVERSSLVSASGEKLKPLSWDGGQGGHHLSGTLKFPPFSRELKSMKLVLTNISSVKERIFEWSF